jgi:predicted metallopeptidase
MATARQTRLQRPAFDFTLHVRHVCEDMTDRLAELRHIDVSRVAISFSQTRTKSVYGMYASLTPLRFTGGRAHIVRRGRQWTMQRLYSPSGREMLYILNLYLPRFLDLSLREKLATIVHELWHISPEFNGDLRRYGGRCHVHNRLGEHDRQSDRLAQKWLAAGPNEAIYDFLKSTFPELRQQYGRVIGNRVPTPKLLPVT